MFWAAVESAAFVLDDPLELIRIGLSMIPPASQISRVIREAVWCWENEKLWGEARDRIATIYGHVQPCNAIPNHGFTIIGWLYGRDFGDKLCKAVNCGFDTDCTGATLGSVLGILGGTKAIPKKWSDPVGKTIKLHKFTGEFNSPKTLEEMTDRTVKLAEQFVNEKSESVEFGDKTSLPACLLSMLQKNRKAETALRQDVRSAIVTSGDVEVILHYHGDPVMCPGISRRLSVSCRRKGEPVDAKVSLELPKDWKYSADESGDDSSFIVSPGSIKDSNIIKVKFETEECKGSVDFVILGPGEAKGIGSTVNVDQCPNCTGRIGACICPKQ
jgi:hypothetical protein